MPDKRKKAKADKWFCARCWLKLFGESIREDPDGAERIMVLMISLRRMIGSRKTGRKTAHRAVKNCVKACIPYIRTQVLAERAQWKFTKHAKKRRRSERG